MVLIFIQFKHFLFQFPPFVMEEKVTFFLFFNVSTSDKQIYTYFSFSSGGVPIQSNDKWIEW